MASRDRMPPAPQLELSQRRLVERVRAEPVAIGDACNLFEAALGTLVLSNGNGAVERNDWRGPDAHQRVIEHNDLRPIRVLRLACCGVNPGDRRFDVILAQIRSRRGPLEQALPARRELGVPLGAVLLE